VSKDHVDVLGETLEEIAREKAGIIKDAPVVTAATGTALAVIKKAAAKKQVPLIVVGEDVKFHSINKQQFHIQAQQTYQVKTHMIGKFQGENIAVALAALEQFTVSKHAVVQGVLKTQVPGRMEVVATHPLILLDGAHNQAAMEHLKATLTGHFTYAKLIVVIGILTDKDINAMMSIIAPLAHVLIITENDNPRACPLNQLEAIADGIPGNHKRTTLTSPTVPEALQVALSIASPQDLICVTGSLFTVGEARSHLDNIFKYRKKF
jgi:dihydrofolate synthase/folylpolyglutamate synthase